ncbi:hypothetical protein [uncultured Azohydromonas sp.]|uniref:hypothetical protein n=1 Tax=uncultured Azohydromonas sp. TaxID=487342 RepID=UPI002622741F|nr:hypothetical protein [uncultured Azohydromonas sp.]
MVDLIYACGDDGGEITERHRENEGFQTEWLKVWGFQSGLSSSRAGLFPFALSPSTISGQVLSKGRRSVAVTGL